MPIQSNRAYNDPSLGAAFSSLAQAFAPPGGADLAGYAAAGATKEKAARLAQLFTMAQSPDFNQSTFDRSNIAAGNYAPTQGFYAQDQNNATAQRGQDVTARTSMSNNAADNLRAVYGIDTNAGVDRRGQDIVAATSTANNGADNVRALEERRLQEAAAMERLGVTDATARYGVDTTAATSRTNNDADNQRALVTAILGAATGPVSQGAVRPGFNPADYGVAAVPAVPQFAGTVAPLSETQQIAQERQRLGQSGQLTDQMLLDTIVGKDAPVQAMGPNGPQYMTPGAAARTGATPYDKPTGATETQNYKTPDGKQGTAFFDTTANTWRDTASQAAVPEGSITFNSSLQGSAAETGLAPTVANTTSGNNLEATLNATDADADALLKLLSANPGIAGLPGDIRGVAQNAMSVIGEMKTAFGDLPANSIISADEAEALLSRVTPGRDPAIQQYKTGLGNLAYRVAMMNNPSGEVSRQAFERSLDLLSGGALGNNQSATEALMAIKEQIARTRETQLRTLRSPGSAQPAPAAPAPPRAPIAPGTVEDGFRFKGGDPAVSTNWEAVQ